MRKFYLENEIGSRLPLNGEEGIFLSNPAGLGMTMPSLEYVKLFRELGGEHVTIGSDAHWAKDIGSHLEVGMDMLKEAGFDTFTVYRRREPKQLKIM